MRTSSISAAASGRPAACTSPMPLSSICQVRESTRIDSVAASARPRVRSASPSEMSSATAGTILMRVTKWVNSAISASTTSGSAPMSYCSRSSFSAAATSPFISDSNRSMTRVRSARPSMVRTSCARTSPAACAIA